MKCIAHNSLIYTPQADDKEGVEAEGEHLADVDSPLDAVDAPGAGRTHTAAIPNTSDCLNYLNSASICSW